LLGDRARQSKKVGAGRLVVYCVGKVEGRLTVKSKSDSVRRILSAHQQRKKLNSPFRETNPITLVVGLGERRGEIDIINRE
jgi:hypothetical protein